LFDQYISTKLTPALGDAGSILEWTTRSERPFHVESTPAWVVPLRALDEVDELGEAVEPRARGVLHPLPVPPIGDDGSQTAVSAFCPRSSACRDGRRCCTRNSAAAVRGKAFAFDSGAAGIFLMAAPRGRRSSGPSGGGHRTRRVLRVRRVAEG